MGRFDTTKATINANIKSNGNQEITGSVLNSVLQEMVDGTDAQLTELSDETNKSFFEEGSISGSTGEDVSDAYVSRTNYIPCKKGDVIEGYYYRINIYDKNYNFIKELKGTTDGWQLESYTIQDDCSYVRLVCRKTRLLIPKINGADARFLINNGLWDIAEKIAPAVNLQNRVNVSLIGGDGSIKPNINLNTRTLDLGASPMLLIGNTQYILFQIHSDATKYRAISLDHITGTSARKLVFNISSCEFYIKAYYEDLVNDEVLIGGIRWSGDGQLFDLPFPYTINGKEEWESLESELSELEQKVSEIETETAPFFTEKFTPQYTIAYQDTQIKNDGFASSTAYQVTNPIQLRKGDTIVLKCYVGVGIYAISLTDKDGSYYHPISVGDGYSVRRYTATEDCYVALGWLDYDYEYPRELYVESSSYLPRVIEKVSEIDGSNVYDRNKDRQGRLLSACRYNRYGAEQDLQMTLITDSHDEALAVSNAAKVTKGFQSINAIIHLGDITGSYYTPNTIAQQVEALRSANKPYYIAIGNHDVGNTYNVMLSADHAQIYDATVRHIVEDGYLKSGEYQSGKCYYYHDFTTQKVRMIVLYEYDSPLDFDETYWQAIPYDASLPTMVGGITYSAGAKANVPLYGGGYKAYSFQAVQSVTPSTSIWENGWPKYRVKRGEQFIRQEQAQWFLDTLASTPSGYGVVVAMHNPFSHLAKPQPEHKFDGSANAGITSAQGQYAMATDFVANAVNAFINKQNYSERVVMNDSYYNTQTENGVNYAYKVSKDFSASKGQFISFIGGHVHVDLIYRHPTYENEWGVYPLCATTDPANAEKADISRIREDGYGYDSLTIASFAIGKISLVKIGNDYTIDGRHRDMETIIVE